MANETLTGSSVVINADIPQTIQETLLQTSNVIDKDIVQTIPIVTGKQIGRAHV